MKTVVKNVLDIHKRYWFFVKFKPITTKYFFLIVCIIGLMWHAVYTNYIINTLKKNEESATDTYSQIIRNAIASKISGTTFNTLGIYNIIGDFDIPVIITDVKHNPVTWQNLFTGPFFFKKEISPNDHSFTNLQLVRQKEAVLTKENKPYVISDSEGATIGYLVLGTTRLIGGLAWMPFIEGIFIVIFAAFVYFALHNILITERSILWVGLAKETAHQLGTPISSLMGWVEYIKMLHDTDNKIDHEQFYNQALTICTDMEKDLTRLRKITSRFSQIGSKPTLVAQDINAIVEESVKYFRTRLPMVGKHIEIKLNAGSIPQAKLNRDLLEWVLENLFKNSVDAIDKSEGLIEIQTEYLPSESLVRIRHTDNGKGISWELYNTIFSPGFTTKTRGWGLGLTLAKRIIEEYHNGRIYVAWSQKGKGTTFAIELHANKNTLA